MVFDDRAHKLDELESDVPPLPGQLPPEHLEPQHGPSRPAERRRSEPLMLVAAFLLLAITVGWIVTIGVVVYWALT